MTTDQHPLPRVALVTGGSAGLGLALVSTLAARGVRVVTDARDAGRLTAAVGRLDGVTAVPGDVTDPRHRADLIAAVRALGRLDLLVANASTLGPVPLRPLADLDPDALARVLDVNVVAPHALVRAALPLLTATGGTVVTISSDAAVEPYPAWGGYAASKAALDQLTAVLAAEHPGLAGYAVDPGDMATDLHAAADPTADPATLADPHDVAGALLALVADRPASGRYRAADLRVPA